MNFTLENLYYIFNIFAPIITAIGIVISFWFSMKSLKEIQKEKVLSQKPYLLFEQGGVMINVVFKKNEIASPGFNPEAMRNLKKDMPNNSVCVYRTFIKNGKLDTFGTLKNYGVGTAFNIKLTWVPKIIWINEEKFVIDNAKKQEGKYSKIYNTKPVAVFNLLPNKTTGIMHLPMFIEMDYNLCITKANGYLQLSYEDLFGNKYSTYQNFLLLTDYKNENPTIIITFSDIFNDEKEWTLTE